ncbi:MAG: DNA mismatch repair endonuclease MutL [Bacilli bacterium]|nr:DNA mismatch repair endonuclease MutL [Bacilli bacterium]
MHKINVMNDDLVNKIAAGEVIEKCASVVKELVENSIDAGSTDIKIDLLESGTKEIRVTDNGFGMSEEDAYICFTPHATSKIYDEDDLYNINTLGFRGEALPSIASVSKVNIKTCDGEEGITFDLINNEIKNKESYLRKGTIITVDDLFYNTPARRKYLSSLPSELSSIVGLINRLSLSHPNIRFTLTNDKKEILKTSGSGNLLKTINEVYGNTVAKKMIEINCENDDYEVSGYISKPDENRSNKNHMITMVNGRVVKNNDLLRCINDSYHKYKPDGKYPIVILNINVDPSLIDVNIHPSKHDIKFSKMDELKELISSNIEKLLDNNFLGVDISTKEVKITNIVSEIETKPEVKEYVLDLSDEVSIKEDETPYEYQDTSVDEVQTEEETKPFPKLFVIGQVLGTYIVCHNEKGMYLIDQHAAEERVNYEKYKKYMTDFNGDTIDMLFPIVLEYPKDEYMTIKEKIDIIRNIGINIEEFGDNTYIIKSHPTWFKEGIEEEFIREIIDKILFEGKNFDLERFNDSISASLACHASVKANTPLSIEEMENIIEKLSKCKNPYNCAHGRPSIIHYSTYELEKLFKRVM